MGQVILLRDQIAESVDLNLSFKRPLGNSRFGRILEQFNFNVILIIYALCYALSQLFPGACVSVVEQSSVASPVVGVNYSSILPKRELPTGLLKLGSFTLEEGIPSFHTRTNPKGQNRQF